MRCIGLVVASVAMLYGCGAPTITRPNEAVWCPSTGPKSQAFDARELLGKSPEQARRDAERQGCDFRVVSVDGEDLAVTADLQYDRVGAIVEDDVVVEIHIG